MVPRRRCRVALQRLTLLSPLPALTRLPTRLTDLRARINPIKAGYCTFANGLDQETELDAAIPARMAAHN